MTCEGIQACSQLTPAAVKLAAKLEPCVPESSYDSMTGSWKCFSNVYTKDNHLVNHHENDEVLVSKPVADLLAIEHELHGYTKTQMERLIDRLTKFLLNGYCIHIQEHKRILEKYHQDLHEVIDNFDEAFHDEFEGKYDDDDDFKDEIFNEHCDEVVHELIIDYEVLLDAEEIFHMK